MTLQFSVDKLYETGWQAADATGCERLPDGRLYPSVLKIQQIFTAAGFELTVRLEQVFDCYRAVWTDGSGAAAGAVVGADERDAALGALAELRKRRMRVAAKLREGGIGQVLNLEG